MSSETVLLLTAEIVLVVVAVLIYVGGAFVRARGVWSWIALGGIIVAALALAASAQPGSSSSGPLEMDRLAWYVRWLALGTGALLVLLASRPLNAPGTAEYVGSLLLAIAGVMLVAGSGELVLLFLGLELVSIPIYILLYLGRRDAASQEATAKYFFLSVLASAMLLYGFSFLYGVTGSTDLRLIGEQLAEPGGFLDLAKVALVLIFAGLGFKIAAVPFHFYAPDVYQGTTYPNAAVLSVVPKIAGMVALVRVVAVAMEGIGPAPWQIAMALAVLSMTFGNLLALWQDNLRRLLAYASIAHTGYLLVGLSAYLASAPDVAGPWDGVGAVLLSLTVYGVATIGTFAALACLGRGEQQIDGVEELAGLGWTAGPTRRILAWAIALFMFSLAGIPPLAGFWGRLALLASALSLGGLDPAARPWFVALAVVGGLNMVVAAAYYLRIVGVIFFRLPLGTPEPKQGTGGAFAATLVCALLVVVIGLHSGPWIRAANRASPRHQPSALPDPATTARALSNLNVRVAIVARPWNFRTLASAAMVARPWNSRTLASAATLILSRDKALAPPGTTRAGRSGIKEWGAFPAAAVSGGGAGTPERCARAPVCRGVCGLQQKKRPPAQSAPTLAGGHIYGTPFSHVVYAWAVTNCCHTTPN